MATERNRTYSLENFAKEHKELNEMGVKIFFLEGWQMYLLLLQNFDQLTSADHYNERWFAVCHVGTWRSKYFNQFLEEFSFPYPTRTHARHHEHPKGGSYFDLFLQIAGGETLPGVVIPEGFVNSISNFVIFVSQEELYAKRILELLTESFKSLKEDESEQLRLDGTTVYIVSENETEVSGLGRFVKERLNNGHTPGQVATELLQNPEYNLLGALRDFDLRME